MMIKKHNIFTNQVIIPALIVFMFCSFYYSKDEPKHKVKTIVIDPGHGGKDPGCNGITCKEKDVALAVALKLGRFIEENIKDVKVIFTRQTDVFVELEDRAKIANDNNADLFISIHCNAAGKAVMIKDKKTGKMRAKTFKNSRGKLIVVETANPEPFGSETYVMGLKNEVGKMKVAQRENSAMLLEDNYKTKYQGFDPDSEESYIIMSNYTSSYVIQSAGLALKIQDQYLNKAGRVDKGVHRQSIWVLWRTSMPSVLTEIGYLTNPQEEKFLGSDKGQTHLAACLFRAFRKYKDEQEGTKVSYNDDIENQIPLEKETYSITDVKDEKTNDKTEEKIDKEIEKENKEIDNKAKLMAEQLAKEERLKLEAENKAKEKALADMKKLKADSLHKIKTDSIKAIETVLLEKEKKYKQYVALADVNFKNKNFQEALSMYEKANAIDKIDKRYVIKKIQEIQIILSSSVNSPSLNTVTDDLKSTNKLSEIDKNKSGIVFKIQFASSDIELDTKTKFVNVPDVWFYKTGATYKYTSGNFNTIENASKHQAKLKELGYKDCFVAAFKNGVRMDINEARKLAEVIK